MSPLAVAVRNLTRHRRRTVVALSALVLGVTATVGARGFINAQHRMMLEGAVDGQLGALQVHRRGYLANVRRSPLQLDFEDSEELRQAIRAIPGVMAVAPRIAFGAMLANAEGAPPSKASAAYLSVTAVDPRAEAEVTPRRLDYLGAGRMPAAADSRELVLQEDIARGLGAHAQPDPASRPPEERWPALLANDRDGAPNGEAVIVTGTLQSAMPGDRKLALLPLSTAQRLLRMEGRVTEYALAVDGSAPLSEVRSRVAAALGEDFEVSTWEELMPLLKELHGYQDAVFNLLSAFFLVVVLLGVVNSMLMSVLERVREIGTMLAIGMRRRDIAGLFVLEGALLGAAGGLLGAALGLGLVLLLDGLALTLPLAGTTAQSVLRFEVSAAYLLSIAAAACASAALASLWPALRASRLTPVEALRHV